MNERHLQRLQRFMARPEVRLMTPCVRWAFAVHELGMESVCCPRCRGLIGGCSACDWQGWVVTMREEH